MNEKDFNFDAVTRLQSYKHRGGIENCFCFCLFKKITDIWESNYWELFYKEDVLRCVFNWEFEVFWIVKRWGALTKLGALLKICFFARDFDLFRIIVGGQNQSLKCEDLHIFKG